MTSIAANVPTQYLWSPDCTHEIVSRNDYTRNDWRYLVLSEALERALSNILQYGYDIDRVEVPPADAQSIKDQILKWTRHIQEEIPGYATWEETYEFTFNALYKPDAIPGEDHTPIGTERDLWDHHFDDDMKRQYYLEDTAVERAKLDDHSATLATSRLRLDILVRIRNRYTPDNPMPDSLAILFRKIYHTYKLREALLGHVGYYNGSIEFAAGMPEGIHRHMYLIDLKLRRPDRVHPFRAPKHSTYYQTDPHSELPWNNQFSFCYGFHEFGPTAMPHFCVNFIERRFVEVIRSDKNGPKWAQLCALMSWDTEDPFLLTERTLMQQAFIPLAGTRSAASALPAPGIVRDCLTLSDCGFRLLTLENIIRNLAGPLYEDEIKLKDFYVHFLALPWSDHQPRTEHNAFAQLYLDRAGSVGHAVGKPMDLTLSNVDRSTIKDPRIEGKNTPPLLALKDTIHDPIVVGRKANIILAPHTAANDFRQKLVLMNEAQLDILFSNIPEYPRHLSHPEKIDVIIHQAVEVARAWIGSANANRRPVYTAPSGHMLTHARAFHNHASGCVHPDHPTPEQFRLTMVATMIGFKQHHSYEEAMFPTHGFEHDGHILEYKDRTGYRDIINSTDPFIHRVGEELVAAAVVIGRQAITSFDEHAAALSPPLEDWRGTVKEWYDIVIGGNFPTLERSSLQ